MAGESFYKPSQALDALTDKQLPGGCDDCDAYQCVAQVERGVYALTVHHDATCPAYREIVARRGGAK